MAKALVIVESPAKAKTINKYLGKDFIVKSSIGHVRDLPVSGGAKDEKEPVVRTKAKSPADKAERTRSALISRMGVDPEHDWAAHYQILPGKEKVIAELKMLAAGVETIYLATDLDREGEAIAWHLREVIGGNSDRYQRVAVRNRRLLTLAKWQRFRTTFPSTAQLKTRWQNRSVRRPRPKPIPRSAMRSGTNIASRWE